MRVFILETITLVLIDLLPWTSIAVTFFNERAFSEEVTTLWPAWSCGFSSAKIKGVAVKRRKTIKGIGINLRISIII
jgi:hypothetical protein